jgi:hypothetical protein
MKPHAQRRQAVRPTGPVRVLVTGSSTWSDRAAVWDRLDALLDWRGQVVVVHGGRPRGADAHAHEWVVVRAREGCAVTEEAYPADRMTRRGSPVPVRNARMVSTGADLCLTFIDSCSAPTCRRQDLHGSHGAVDCATRAQLAGIPVEHLT